MVSHGSCSPQLFTIIPRPRKRHFTNTRWPEVKCLQPSTCSRSCIKNNSRRVAVSRGLDYPKGPTVPPRQIFRAYLSIPEADTRTPGDTLPCFATTRSSNVHRVLFGYTTVEYDDLTTQEHAECIHRTLLSRHYSNRMISTVII